jgi:hypothetical protein
VAACVAKARKEGGRLRVKLPSPEQRLSGSGCRSICCVCPGHFPH